MKADLSRITFDRAHHRTDVVSQQGRVMLDADWNEQRAIDAHLRTTALRDVIGEAGAPIDADAFAVTATGATLTLSAGRFYLGGHLLECDEDTELTAQPDLPAAGPFVRRLDGAWVEEGDSTPAGVYVAWLTSWSQHRTALEEPAIREIALGGPDTTTRLRTLWHVRLLGAGAPGAEVSCADEPPGWNDLTDPSTGTLAVYADPEGEPAPDCLIPEASPYRGLDNQLYRIEIHQPGPPGTATFKWSADNGAVVASWEATDVDVLTVKNPGRDGSTGFTPGCWVELTDDRHEQLGLPGSLVQVDRAEGDRLFVVPGSATGSLDRSDFTGGRPRARRWDGRGTVPPDGAEIAFELGVRGTFGDQPSMTYRTGDHWMVPARTATADVEWPTDGAGPAAVTPHGPQRRHTRLAILDFDGTAWSVRTDCRPVFAPLVDHLALHYVGGDGQDVLPDVADPTALVPLNAPLVVGVSTGGRPVADARVKFTVTQGDGTVEGGGEAIVATGAAGLADAAWSLDSTNRVQTVTAQLLDRAGQPIGLPSLFTATTSVATDVGYDPADAPSLAGATTVQEAIDRLAGAGGGGGCDTLVLSPDAGWTQALENLAQLGTDVTVCLRPGRYETERTVRIAGVRHLRLTGAGAASEFIGHGVECVVSIEGAESVVVRDLAARVASYPGEPVSAQRGVLTVVGCRDVEVADLRLACPAATRPRATCLTIRSGADGDPAAVTESATVRDSTFTVGHAQTGALIVNAKHSDVRGNRFVTPTGTIRLTDLLGDRRVVDNLVGTLVARAVPDRRLEGTTPGGRNTALTVGDWRVRFDSAVPVRDWVRLVAAEPPAATDTETPAAVAAYMDRLAGAAAVGAQPSPAPGGEPTPPPGTGRVPAPPASHDVRVLGRAELDRRTIERIGRLENATGRRLLRNLAETGAAAHPPAEPAARSGAGGALVLGAGEDVASLSDAALAVRLGALPAFDRQLSAIRHNLGDAASSVLDGPAGAATRRALLVSSDFGVVPLATVARGDRAVAVTADRGVVRFDSPLPQSAWDLALAEMPPADRSPTLVARHLRTIGRRLVTDADFAGRVAPGLLDRFAAREPSVSANAVRIGGRLAETVHVTGNHVVGAAEGVHVGLSHQRPAGGALLQAASVRISGNDIALRVPIDRERAPRAIFVGNAERAAVTDNRCAVSGGSARAGVLVDGGLGRHLVVRNNELAGAVVGVGVRDRTRGRRGRVLWLIADNIAPDAATAVVAPAAARVTGNVS